MLNKALSYWNEAGERPYEVLIEEGLYDYFITHIQKQSLLIEGNIYRGTKRHFQLKIGETLRYENPTSWTTNFEIAKRFIEGVDKPVILVLSSFQPLKAIFNYNNTYQEEEVIIDTMTLRVINKDQNDKLTILEVVPHI